MNDFEFIFRNQLHFRIADVTNHSKTPDIGAVVVISVRLVLVLIHCIK